jgi:hypothetical protein
VKPFRILDDALLDLDTAASWYEEQRQGLGQELLGEFRELLEAALERPGTGVRVGDTPGGNEIRRYRLQRFKRYAILVATIRQEPTVLAFEHSSRRPGFWRDRLKSS